ncbi:hypothetical protein [Sporichthya sp.]|uniref:hypothetical protein n=1 Tax=Sporichthya sp. TaxID=65475 RepID=UPI0017D604C4|nr:hypothetical protein [Sporichthya sp.]MBA3743657.1 hypothetical protein [Sporichthya sp.]
MDAERTRLLRELLAGTEWTRRTTEFARSLRGAKHNAGGLLLVGTPTAEPWHLAAHLDDEARLAGLAELSPVLVRHAVPLGAPPHLAIDLSRLEAVRRGETVLLAAEDAPGEGVLERVADARRAGATVLAMDAGDGELAGLAHDRLSVGPGGLVADGLIVPVGEGFEIASHLVSTAAGAPLPGRGVRARLSRALEAVSGPAPKIHDGPTDEGTGL